MQHLLACFTSSLWRRVSAVALLPFLLLILLPVQAASAQSSGFITSGWTITPVSGTINVLVVGCYFSDTDDPAVLSRATDGIKKMYGSANEQPTISHYFNRVSNGNVQIVADVRGWYRLPYDFNTYNTDSSKSQDSDCRKRVAEQFNPASYRIVVMLFNNDTGMSNHYDGESGKYIALRPWGGHGGWSNHATHVHEIGHALGLPHSHSVIDAQTPADLNDPYSNPWDPMSGFDETSQNFFYWDTIGGWCNGYYDFDKTRCIYTDTAGKKHVAVQFSAYQKLRLGWLSDQPTNTHVFRGGNISYPLQAVGSHGYIEKQLLAVPLEDLGFYAVEYRKRDVDYYEGGLPDDGVLVYYVDTSSKPTDAGDGRLMRVLHPGESFNEGNAFTITYDRAEGPEKAIVSVTGPAPTPKLTSITPNYGSSARRSPNGFLPVTLTGSKFVPLSRGHWNAQLLDGQGVAGGGYNAPTTLKVRVEDSLLNAGRSGFVSVVNWAANMADSDATRSNLLPFFVSPSGAATVDSASTTATTGATTSVVAGKLTVSGTGTGSLAAATFASNPGANADYPSADRWYAALVDEHHAFGQVQMTSCDVNGGTLLRWWDGAQWAPVNPQATLDAKKCLVFTAKGDGSTTPNIGKVAEGALFAVARSFGLANVTTPAQVDEGSELVLTGDITTPSTAKMGLTVDWGDGRTETVWLAAKTRAFTRKHAYSDNPKGSPIGAYRIRVTLTDSNGTVAATQDKEVKVANVAPVPDIRTDVQSEAPGNPVTAYIHIADPGLRGTEGDTFNASIDWGDGKVQAVAVPIAQGGFAAQHVYANLPGLGPTPTTIKVTVTDDDGASGSASTSITVLFGTAATRVLMCDEFNYGGRCRIIREPELANVTSVGDFNDYWSSISIEGPVVVSVFEHFNFQGRCETFTASDPRLDNNVIGNDAISSIRVGKACP